MNKQKLLIILLLCLSGCSITQDKSDIITEHGFSKDFVYGFDTGIIWKHLYLKNDHTTTYCFDDDKLIPILENAINNNKEVIVNYEKNVLRGSLCLSGTQKSSKYTSQGDTVIVVNITQVN